MLSGSLVISSGMPSPSLERSFADPIMDGAMFSGTLEDDYREYTGIEDFTSAAGVQVTRRTALGFAPFWAAIDLISSDMGCFPIWVTKTVKTKEGVGNVRDFEHSANIIETNPNKFMTRYTFMQTLISHAVYRGNGYAYVVRDGGGRNKELLILDPTMTWPVIRNGVLWYVTTLRGKVFKLDAEDVIHIKGFGNDGIQGYDLLTYAKKTLGLALATRESRSRFFQNGANPSVVLECPGRMPPKVLKQLKNSWQKLYSGVSNHHKTAILQMGTSAKVLSQSARDAQLIEGQEVDVMHISAITHVPPHKIGGRGRVNYGSMEQENESYMSDCILHWVTACKLEFARKLLTEKEKKSGKYSIEIKTEAKVRANLLTRYQAYGIGILNRWLVPNDVRLKEGDNPLPWGNEPVDFQKSGGVSDPTAGGTGSLSEQDVIALVQKIMAGQQP